MSDVSNTTLDRNKTYSRRKWSFRERGAGDLAILWRQSANTQAIFFWFLAYMYSTPGLLDQLREDTAPHVKLSQPTNLEIVSMDLPALFSSCPLMKACIFEPYRMANEATSIRYVARPITISDDELRHELQLEMFVSVPHSVTQRVYAEEHSFVPGRFLESDLDSGKKVARYGRLRPWGTGAAISKGRTFADKELITLGAAVISLWNIGPADGAGRLPAMVPGTGLKKLVGDIRVAITWRGQHKAG